VDLAVRYDAINTAIFLPSGGSGRLRQRLVDPLHIQPGHRVLELGCGTGQVTTRLCASGAEVVAVDGLAEMVARARRRAPEATFIESDVRDAPVGASFDRVVLSFLLHNFDATGRRQVLAKAQSVLAPGGRVGILEWALPAGHRRAALWRRFLGRLEPSPAVAEILDGALSEDLDEAGLRIDHHRPVAGGRVALIVAAPFP
jgi:ubiquinone/menaquinone biosynthesis C-methylase UbiE